MGNVYSWNIYEYLYTLQNYEARIDALQKQVEEQSMTMSMYSSYTPEELNTEEDIFGTLKCRTLKNHLHSGLSSNPVLNCVRCVFQ